MQDIIVILIGCIVFGSVALRMYKILTSKPKPNDKCGGCTGCALKEKVECSLDINTKKFD